MSEFTLQDLKSLLAKAAGDESTINNSDDLEKEFDDLGYDSLALIEVASLIKQERGLAIPDELLTELDTPTKFLRAVNSLLSQSDAGVAK